MFQSVVVVIHAHHNPLVAMAFNPPANKIVTASEKVDMTNFSRCAVNQVFFWPRTLFVWMIL